MREQEWLWTSTAILFHSGISGNCFKVYSGLSSYANNLTQKAFPSIATLSKRLHMGRTTVMRALETLEEVGAIAISKQTGEHNIYILLKITEELKAKKEVKIPEEAPKENWVKTILEWAEKRRSSKFVIYGKQVGALGLMQKAGYSPREISECYLLMEKNDFWKQRGFDFTNVAVELPKKIIGMRAKQATPQFEHVTQR